MARAPTLIRTPDQRLRVFVSSTLQELAAERAAAKEAIGSLHLAPVLFELGARPHPPRELYRAYLEQSHIFVGIYWQRYGWVAPGMEISGLEDEWRLAAEKPKLIYLKTPAPEREPRLSEMLEHVKAAEVSYKPFQSAEELRELLAEDLALLLTERFERADVLPASDAEPKGFATLPTPLTPLVGREAEISAVVRLLARPDIRLVTLYGPGGIGKSRLALEVARALSPSFRDGVCFVALASVTDPERLAAVLAQALGLKESSGEEPLPQLRDTLRDRELLLFLDNFEQLLEAAPLVSQLLMHAPRLKVLVTSRAVLHLSGEVEYPVPPLGLPHALDEATLAQLEASEAVQLFVARAKAVQPTFELTTANAAAVAELCQRLDGLPLAIELAAAHLRMLPPEALLTRLKRRLPMLSLAARDLPERQQTLTRTLDWSYNLLTPEERGVFARIAVFVGGAELEMVESACGDEGWPLDALLALADKSLVQLRQHGDGSTRFSMLRTVREYALDKLAASGEEARVRQRHADVFLALAERAVPALIGREQRRWLARLTLELDNLRAAMGYLLEAGDAAKSLRLATTLRWYCMMSGNFSEGRRWFAAALALPGEVDAAVRGAALTGAGALAWRQGDLAEARPMLVEALALQRTIGDKRGEAATLRNLGLLEHNEGDYAAAKAFHEASLEVMRALSDDEGVANALLSLGNVALDQGDAQARRYYQQSLEIAERIGDELGAAYALDNLGVAAWHFGNLAEAERLTAACEERYGMLEHQHGLANVAHRFGLIAYQHGRWEEARERFSASLRVKEALGDGRGRAFLLLDLGRVALRQGEHLEAAARWRHGLELVMKLGMRAIALLFVEGAAELAHACGRAEPAARLFAAAAAFRKHAGVPIAPVNLPHYQHVTAAVRHALSADAYAAATREGHALAFEQAMAEALELTQGFAPLPVG